MSKKGKKVWERVYNERTSYLMLLPNIIMFAVFTVYPILWALRYMLFDYRGYGEAKFVGMDNFVRVFTRDPVFWDSVVNTFVYVGGKLILTLPIAFMLAFLLSKSTRINAVMLLCRQSVEQMLRLQCVMLILHSQLLVPL